VVSGRIIKTQIKKALAHFGYDVVRRVSPTGYPADFGPEDIEVIEAVGPYTMTTAPTRLAMIRAVEYVVSARIPGAFVECGVWRGGSMMIAAMVLKRLGAPARDLHLYDTFEGMTPPTEVDRRHDDASAQRLFQQTEANGQKWCYSAIDEVRANLRSTGYDAARVHFVKGPVEETIPATVPDEIALLRLDTDWYESTKHELVHLFPRLARGGVLIIDDYGHWKGSRRATDEYFREQNIVAMLHRVDYASRVVIKA